MNKHIAPAFAALAFVALAVPAAQAGPAFGPPGWQNSAPDPLSHPPPPPVQLPDDRQGHVTPPPPPNPRNDPDVQRGIDSYRRPSGS